MARTIAWPVRPLRSLDHVGELDVHLSVHFPARGDDTGHFVTLDDEARA
jgi:hypothetical protein